MLKEVVLLGIGAIFGLGTAMAALAAPTYYPNTPQWALHLLFWGGLTLMALMLLDVVLLLAWPLKTWSAVLLNIGLPIVALAAIVQTFPAENSFVELSKNEGILIPGNEPTPIKPKCNFPANSLQIFMGSNAAGATGFPVSIITMGNQSLFSIDRDKETSNLVVTRLQIFDDADEIIATIDPDGFWVKNTSRKKRPDRSTLVVYDKRDQQVLLVKFLNHRALYVEGVFRLKGFLPVIIKSDFTVMGGLHVSHSCFQMAGPSVVYKHGR